MSDSVIFQLPSDWRFWFVMNTKPTRNSGALYQIEEIVAVSSAENFFRYFYSLPKVSEIKCTETKRISIALFRGKIKPAWEDPENQNGCEFIFRIAPQKVDEIWEKILVYLIGGSFKDKIELNGVIITRKTIKSNDGRVTIDFFEVQFWSKNKASTKDNNTFIDFICSQEFDGIPEYHGIKNHTSG